MTKLFIANEASPRAWAAAVRDEPAAAVRGVPAALAVDEGWERAPERELRPVELERGPALRPLERELASPRDAVPSAVLRAQALPQERDGRGHFAEPALPVVALPVERDALAVAAGRALPAAVAAARVWTPAEMAWVSLAAGAAPALPPAQVLSQALRSA
jgi:hypothetical protein